MARKVKCPVCSKLNDKEYTIEKGRKYYCPECLRKQQKQADNYKDLIGYICYLYDISAPTGRMVQQIKSYSEEYGYTYYGMKKCLEYFYELEEREAPDVNEVGLGIIPYVYDEAKRFYGTIKANNKDMKQLKAEDVVKDKKVIYSPRQEDRFKYKGISIIDIDDIEDDEEE